MKLAELIANEAGVGIEHVMLLRHASKTIHDLLAAGGTIEGYTALQPIGSKYDYRDPKKPPIDVVAVIIDDTLQDVYRVLGVEAEGTNFTIASDVQRQFDITRGKREISARRFALSKLPSVAIGKKVTGWERRQRMPVQRSGDGFFDEIKVDLRSASTTNSGSVAAAVGIKTSKQLEQGQVYTREELRGLFGITAASLNNGLFRPKGHDSVWLFITENKSADRTQFHDRLDGDALTMQGQISGQTDHWITDHRANGLDLLLFYRTDRFQYEGAGFRYEGVFEYESRSGGLPTTFVLKRMRSSRRYKHGKKRTWELARDAIVALGGAASAKDILAHVASHFPNYKKTNLASDLNMLSVNSPSRGQYSQNAKPRRTDSINDFDRLFKRGRGTSAFYEIYVPIKHGVWELYVDHANGTSVCKVRLVSDDEVTQQLDQASQSASQAQAFDASSVEDARERTLGAIVRRQGQPAFRRALIEAYGGCCVFSGCSFTEVLEAAHIHPYMGVHTNVVSNGLLLRADIHTLFDLGRIWVDPESLLVQVSSRLDGSEYENLRGRSLLSPSMDAHSPSRDALRWHAEKLRG